MSMDIKLLREKLGLQCNEDEEVLYCIIPQTSISVNMTINPPGIFIYSMVVGMDKVDKIVEFIDEFYNTYNDYLVVRPNVTISTKHDEMDIYDVGVDMEFNTQNIPGEIIEAIIRLVELFKRYSL